MPEAVASYAFESIMTEVVAPKTSPKTFESQTLSAENMRLMAIVIYPDVCENGGRSHMNFNPRKGSCIETSLEGLEQLSGSSSGFTFLFARYFVNE